MKLPLVAMLLLTNSIKRMKKRTQSCPLFLKTEVQKMTIIEAINRIDTLKPNTYAQETKVYWLSKLDGIIFDKIIKTHEGAEMEQFNGYSAETPIDTKLIVSAPYDDIYIKWLEAQIDYANREYDKYNNGIVAYNDAYTEYMRYYNRTHMPKGKSFKYF